MTFETPSAREFARQLQETGEFAGVDLDRIVPEVYEQLRSLAARQLRGQGGEHTLSATALAHEAYLRLSKQTAATWRNRAQVLAIASRIIRRLLVDHARARAVRRPRTAPVGDGAIALNHAERTFDLMALDEALEKLKGMNHRHHRLVELRFFGGLTIAEASEVLDVSPATAKRDWELTRAWLYRELFGTEESARS